MVRGRGRRDVDGSGRVKVVDIDRRIGAGREQYGVPGMRRLQRAQQTLGGADRRGGHVSAPSDGDSRSATADGVFALFDWEHVKARLNCT